LERDEKLRESLGGAIGSEETAREIHQAAGSMLAPGEGWLAPAELEPGVAKDTFAHVDAAETHMLEVQRVEKQKHAARLAGILKTLGKLLAVCTANPVLFAVVDVVTDVAAMAYQWYAAGEAYDPHEDLKHLALDALTDAVTAGIAKAA